MIRNGVAFVCVGELVCVCTWECGCVFGAAGRRRLSFQSLLSEMRIVLCVINNGGFVQFGFKGIFHSRNDLKQLERTVAVCVSSFSIQGKSTLGVPLNG